EGMSQLYSFQLDMLAPADKAVDFAKLLGEPVTVELEAAPKQMRHFHGIVSRFSQGRRDATYAHYRMEVGPPFWLLTLRTESRVFQQITVPDILKKVLKGLDAKWDLQGRYEPRDYCVQYRESDFAFASRLMEEEGIYYYFAHGDNKLTMIVADKPVGHADLP